MSPQVCRCTIVQTTIVTPILNATRCIPLNITLSPTPPSSVISRPAPLQISFISRSGFVSYYLCRPGLTLEWVYLLQVGLVGGEGGGTLEEGLLLSSHHPDTDTLHYNDQICPRGRPWETVSITNRFSSPLPPSPEPIPPPFPSCLLHTLCSKAPTPPPAGASLPLPIL